MSFTSSLNYTQTITQDASGSLILQGSGSTGRTDLFTVNGNNGTLFSVSDDLSDSLFSVNTIAGLPVIEAFANNTVVMGQYGQNVLVVTGSSVGIGTTTPGYKLDVVGEGRFGTGAKAIIGTDGTYGGYSTIGFGGTTNGSNRIFAAADGLDGLYIAAATSRGISFRVNGDTIDNMYINSNGKVGIGTTGPTETLDVRGVVRISRSGVNDSGILAFGNFVNGSGYYDNGIFRSALNTISTSGNILHIGSYEALAFTTSTHALGSQAIRMFINGSNGYVGIGTTNPGYQLEVNGWVGASRYYPYNTNSTYIDGDGSGIRITGTGYLYVPASGGSYFEGSVRMRGSISNDNGAYLQINGGTSGHTYFNGNVGIGTTNPATLHHIYGSGNIFTRYTNTSNSGHYVDVGTNSSGDGFIYSYGAYPLLFGTNGSTRMTILSGGNVGIGTTAPDYRLDIYDVSSAARVRVRGTANFTLFHTQNTSGNLYLGIDSSAAGGFSQGAYSRVLYSDGAYPLVISTNDAARMTIGSGGALRFHAYGSGTNTGTVAYNLAVDSSGNVIETAGGVIDGSGTANYVPKWSDANTLTNSVMYDDGTNVGIGTTSPYSGTGVRSLNINATSYPVLALSIGGTLVGSLVGYSGYTTLGTKSGNYLVFAPDDTERMRITAGGTLLVGGTVTPSEGAWKGTSVFGINGYDKVITGTLISSYTGATIAGHNSALTAWSDLNINGGNIIFRYQETEYMRMNTSGQLGIGTTSPAAKLDVVDGNIRTNKALISQGSNSSWTGAAIFMDWQSTFGRLGAYNYASSTWMPININDGSIYSQGSGGNVGIGTTDPSGYKLRVNGTTLINGSLTFSETGVIKKRFTSNTNNPVKTVSGVLASRSENSSGNTYYVIETNVPQDDYQMGGFTIELFGRYGETNNKTKIDLGGYWNAESNSGFQGFEAHGSNPQYKPTIEVARNSSGNVAFIIYGVSWSYPIIVARDLWLGYNGTQGDSYGEGWYITATNDTSSYSNKDTVVWRNAYSDSNPAGYTTNTGTVTSVGGTGTVNGITLTGTVTTSGNLTLGGTLGSIANSQLTNSSITVGSTAISLGSSATTIAGLSSVTSTTFVGALSGNATTATNVAWTGITSGYRENYNIGFRPADNSSSYAGFSFASPGNNEDAGYFLIRGGADSDVYTQNGITLVADLGWLTLAQRTQSNKGIRFMTGASSTTRMTILNGGNVGIGTTNPGATLAVGTQSSGTSGAGVAADNSIIGRFGAANTAARVVGLTVANTATSTVGNDSTLSFIVAGNYSATGLISTILQNTSTAASDMAFTVYANSLQERMRIQGSTGNVGIGTNSPQALLDVGGGDGTPAGEQFGAVIKGYSTGNRTLYFDGNSAASVWWGAGNTPQFAIDSMTGGGATFWTHAGGSWVEQMRIKADGSVGIGTTNPGYKLDVNGTGRFPIVIVGTSTVNSGNTKIQIASTAASNKLGFSGGANFITEENLYVWDFTTGASAGISFQSNGVVNATTFVGALSGNATTATNLSTNRTNWSTNGTISAVVGQLAWKNYGNNHTIFDASNSTTPNGGSTNNTNPDVPWTGTYPTLMGWNGSNTYGVRVDSARTADSTSAVSGTTNYVAKFTSGTAIGNSQIFDDGTNVGIGTTSPFNKLTVNGGISGTPSWNNATVELRAEGGTTAAIVFHRAGFTSSEIYSDNGAIAFRENGADRLRITGGNVGIGTSSPGYKLEVVGTTGLSSDLTMYGGSGYYLRLNGGTGALGYDSGNNQILSYTTSDTTMWMGSNKSQITPTVKGGITEIISQDQIQNDYVSAASVQGTIITKAVSGAAVTIGQVIVLNTANQWVPADADAASTSTKLLGVALTTVGGANSQIAVLLDGIYNTSIYHDQVASPATPGMPLYISTNSGYVTQTAPSGTGKVVRLIGHNLYGTTGRSNVAVIRFKPDNTWIQL